MAASSNNRRGGLASRGSSLGIPSALHAASSACVARVCLRCNRASAGRAAPSSHRCAPLVASLELGTVAAVCLRIAALTHHCSSAATGRDGNAIAPPRIAGRRPPRADPPAAAPATDKTPGREHAPPRPAPLPGFRAGRLLTSWRRPRDLLSSENAEEEFWRTVTNSAVAPRRPRRGLLSQSRPIFQWGVVESSVVGPAGLRQVEIHRRVLGC